MNTNESLNQQRDYFIIIIIIVKYLVMVNMSKPITVSLKAFVAKTRKVICAHAKEMGSIRRCIKVLGTLAMQRLLP